MSGYRKNLAQFDGQTVTVVGRVSLWRDSWMTLEQFVVLASPKIAFEEHHVHLRMGAQRQKEFHPGDWVEVSGEVYHYEKQSGPGLKTSNCSVTPELAKRLWRPTSETGTDEIAYAYTNQLILVSALRGERRDEINEHFTVSPEFDSIFSDLIENAAGTHLEWSQPGKDSTLYRITVGGPFLPFKEWAGHKKLTSRQRRGYRNKSDVAGSRVSDWRFTAQPIGHERWMKIEMLSGPLRFNRPAMIQGY